jgi:general secretion pathway protein D
MQPPSPGAAAPAPGGPASLGGDRRRAEGGIYPGAGPLVGQPLRPRPTAQAAAAEDGVTLNFVGADVRELARAVLGDILHLTYVVDPRLQATVTVQTGAPLPREAVLPTLDNVLRASGAALVQTDALWRVVPADEAPRAGVPLAADPSAPGFGISILPLRFASAGEVRKTLDPFIPTGGVVSVDAARNLLLVSGSREERESMADIVRAFDVDWMKGMSFGLFPLKVGRAPQVVDELAAIFGEGAMGGALRFVPIERLNAILAISPQEVRIREARQWVDRLDYGDDETTPRLFHYNVQNARAVDIAAVLADLLGGAAGGARRAVPELGGPEPGLLAPYGPGVSPAQRQGAAGVPPADGISGAPAGAQLEGQPGARQPGGAAPMSLQPGRGPQSRAALGVARRAAQAPLAGPVGEGGLETPEARIVADERNNAVVVYARPRDYRMIEGLLRSLDAVPLQVMIEATIAEVTLNDSLRYGLQFFLTAGSSTFEQSNRTTGGGAIGDILSVFPGFNYALATRSARVLLTALSNITDVNVVSSPQLLVQDHQTAGLLVGDQVPVPVQSAIGILTPNAPIVNTIQYRDTGVILQVTPRVNTTGQVTLDVSQEVSDVAATTSSTIDAPTIRQRKISSTVIVQDGQTVALGGLIRDSRTDGRSGTPFLSDLPLIGPLFRTTDKAHARTELLVLLTPRVVRSPVEARRASEELRERMQSTRPLIDDRTLR